MQQKKETKQRYFAKNFNPISWQSHSNERNYALCALSQQRQWQTHTNRSPHMQQQCGGIKLRWKMWIWFVDTVYWFFWSKPVQNINSKSSLPRSRTHQHTQLRMDERLKITNSGYFASIDRLGLNIKSGVNYLACMDAVCGWMMTKVHITARRR